MAEIGLNHKPKRKPNAITKADREASKSNDLIKRDFAAEKPLEKCMRECPKCHAVHDRDTNASINILKKGLQMQSA